MLALKTQERMKTATEVFFRMWSFIFLFLYCFGCVKCDSDSDELPEMNGGLSSEGKFILYATAGVTFLVLGCWLLFRSLRSKRRIVATEEPCTDRSSFAANDLWLATRGYHENNLIGSTPWGTVFKGILQDGLVVAIKRLKLSKSDEANQSFFRILNILMEIRHQNLVPILGFAVGLDYKELVMQYVDCESLDKYLHGEEHCNLSLETRIKIAQGTARALVYLHEQCGVKNNNNNGLVIHGNLKPSNIFVDLEDQEPLLSDYGIASLVENFSKDSSTFLALHGYAAPECKRSEPATAKSDVYSYGMLLLELLTLKRPATEDISGDLPGWVRYRLRDKRGEILDPAIFAGATTSKRKKIVRILGIALMCTREDPQRRPAMKEVFEMLTEIKGSGINQSKIAAAPSCDIEEV